MNLDAFVERVLRQIVKGVKTAQGHEDCKDTVIGVSVFENPVNFSVAVTESGVLQSTEDPYSARVEFSVPLKYNK